MSCWRGQWPPKSYNLQLANYEHVLLRRFWLMAGTKTIAVSEAIWERLKEVMKREQAKSMNEAVAKLLEKGAGGPRSRFGVHKRLRLKLSQEEHEETTRDTH